MFFDKIKKIKSTYVIAALAAGVIMVVLSNSFSSPPKEDRKQNAESTFDYEYVSRELKEIIEGIDGVSDVSVFVSYENSGVDKIATVGEKHTDASNGKIEEKTLAVTKKDGSAEAPFIKEKIFPGIRGVIISARGIRTGNMEKRISEAVSSALGVPLHRVRIIPRD